MSGIDRQISLDERHIAKHLPNTQQVQRLLRRGRSAMVCSLTTQLVIELAQMMV
jgi:hypothetical protein